MKSILIVAIKALVASIVVFSTSFGQSLEDFQEIDAIFVVKHIREIERLANEGDMDAQSVLGAYYSNGIRVKQNKHVSEKWYLLAAKQGHKDAQYNLGQIYRNGDLGLPDYTSALYWYEEAARNKVLFAPSSIAGMHYQGMGTNASKIMATKWMIIADNFGDKVASRNLTILKDSLSKSDYLKARELAINWLKKNGF